MIDLEDVHYDANFFALYQERHLESVSRDVLGLHFNRRLKRDNEATAVALDFAEPEECAHELLIEEQLGDRCASCGRIVEEEEEEK